MICDKGAPLPSRLRLPARGVLRSLQLELGVELCAEQHDVEGEIEPEEKHDHRAERAVSRVVMGKIRDVEREAGRGEQPEVANTEPTLTHCHFAVWRHGP